MLRRFWHRLPWLLLGLAGAFLAAGIVGSFERQLEENVILAFFMPGIVYMADAVGTQTETLVVRGISVGVPIRRSCGASCSPASWWASLLRWRLCLWRCGAGGKETWWLQWLCRCSRPAR